MRRVLLFIVIALAPSPIHAQSITTGAIQGVITDAETGEPLPGVTVIVGGQTAITDADGAYKITELLPGTYDVVLEFETAKVTRSGVQIGASHLTSLYQAMKIGEAVHVDGSPPPINVDSPAKEKRIDRGQLESLPVPGTTFADALGSVPGSQHDGVGVAFSGASALESRYFVDGLDITGLTYGDVGTPILSEFIHEIVAVTGGYTAEYGRATGGVINIITRRGTDWLRGSVFGMVKPGVLAARVEAAPRNASAIDLTANSAYSGQLGFELGGPIVPGRAWFYLGVAPQLARTDITRTTKRQTDCRVRLDSGAASGCDAANADGEADVDPDTGFFVTDVLDEEVRSATSRSTQVIGKLDVAATPDDQGQITVIAMPQASRSPAVLGLPSTGRRSWGLTTDVAARWTSKLGGGTTELEAIVAWHRSTTNSGAIDPVHDAVPLQLLLGGDLGRLSRLGGESAATVAGCTDGGPGDPYALITNCPTPSYAIGGPGGLSRDSEERRSARVGAIRRFRAGGAHELKAGLDVEDNRKTATRIFSGGSLIQNQGGSIVVSRYAELARPGDLDPRFDRTCTTPDPSGGMGGAADATRSYRCRYLGGVEDPSTRIGGQTVTWAAYVQDAWHPTRSLTINAGLRYDEQRLRYARALRGTVDPLTGERLGSNAMTLRGNFAPRLGAIWDPTEQGRSKLYAAWGRYYEGIPMDINDRSFGGEVSLQQTFDASACGPIDPATGFADGTRCTTTSARPRREQLLGGSGVLVAPGVKAQYMDEGLLGGELALGNNVVFGAVVQHRRMGRVLEDVSTDGAQTYIIANPGEWSAAAERDLLRRIATATDKLERDRLSRQLELFRGIRLFDRPVRDYHALELTVSRRFASGLYLSTAYTYSRAEGNYPGLVSYDNGQIDPNISSQYDLIELLGNRRGPLPQDRPHYLKIDAYRDVALSARDALTIGTRIRALSGIPQNALGAHYLYGADESFVLPRGQLGRTDFEHGLDVHVAYKRRLTATTAAELFVDVFNLTNRQGTARVDNTYAPRFSQTAGGSGGIEQNVNPISGGSYADLIWAKAIDRDGNETATPIGRNPNFGRTTARYAPAAAQVGFRVTF